MKRHLHNEHTAIIFDFDGVIVDSEDHWSEVENPYLHMHTVGWEDDDYARLIGMGLHEVYQLLLNEYHFALSEENYFSDYEVLAQRLYTELASPIKGVSAFLEYLKSAGFKVAIASSSKPTWIKVALERHGLSSYFSAIVSSHDADIAHGKPAPDVYLKAAHELDLATDKVVVIEDSTNGIRAAKAAGMVCIGLNVDGNSTQDMSQCDLVVKSYSELKEFLIQM